ncbi:MAG TPA: fructosamine kinase family protein [Polyangiaceae bacterium]
MTDSSWRASVEAALGARISRSRPLSGGDINEAYALELADGRRVFLKTNAHADAAMFLAEARGLAWLEQARCLRVPSVVAVASGSREAPGFLVLELIESARRCSDFDERLGRGLADLHRSGTASFGLDHDNFIGRLPQSNRVQSSWPEFYWQQRLLPQLERAAQAGHVSVALRKRFDRLEQRLPEWVGPAEPPSRLHGDLWGGNLHVDERGLPCLIDPAVYGGHREIDLAMMRLFGGFGSRVFEAYREAFPLAPEHEQRVPLYQLYPLLVHVNLFGASYVGQVARALEPYS